MGVFSASLTAMPMLRLPDLNRAPAALPKLWTKTAAGDASVIPFVRPRVAYDVKEIHNNDYRRSRAVD
jgi:hypothetical protein